MGSNGDRATSRPTSMLRKQSLYFNNFYATGTRTDRGLEAITLSIPPRRALDRQAHRPRKRLRQPRPAMAAVGYDACSSMAARLLRQHERVLQRQRLSHRRPEQRR
jgi:hypothetical protein